MQPPPAWCQHYLGIPYVSKGLSLETGLDCWGLVYHVLRREFAQEIPDYQTTYETEATTEVVAEVVSGPAWIEVSHDQRKPGDVLWFRSLRGVAHAGVVVSRDYFLHCNIGTAVVVARIDLPFWASRVLGTFRFAGEPLASE